MLVIRQDISKNHIRLFARHQGVYQRPISGEWIDLRLEDIVPLSVIKKTGRCNILAKLPDIGTQVNQYIAIYNACRLIMVDCQTAMAFIDTGLFFILPHQASSPYWHFTRSAWWEYPAVYDQRGYCLKAPKRHRPGEPVPGLIDEKT